MIAVILLQSVRMYAGSATVRTKGSHECDCTVSSLLNRLKIYKVEKCEAFLSCGTWGSSP